MAVENGKVAAEEVRVMGEAPRMVKSEQEMLPVHEAEVVAAPYTPAPPLLTRRFEEDG